MKKLILLNAFTLIIACKPAPKKLIVYTYTISSDRLGINGYESFEKKDTVMGTNDTMGYMNAFISYKSIAITSKHTHANKNISFLVTDSTGVNLKSKLPKKTIDSIENVVNSASKNN